MRKTITTLFLIVAYLLTTEPLLAQYLANGGVNNKSELDKVTTPETLSRHMANGNAKATFTSQRNADNFAGTGSSLKTGARKAVSVDANGIITDVEGEAKYYTRTGTAYYASGQQVYSDNQSGHVTIVTAEDGTLYIKDIISRYTTGAWVKATKSGNTLTVAAGQPVNYNRLR